MNELKPPITEPKYKELVLELIMKLFIEQDALKNTVMNELSNLGNNPQEELDSLNSFYADQRELSKRNLQVQLKNKYGLPSIDALLNSL